MAYSNQPAFPKTASEVSCTIYANGIVSHQGTLLFQLLVRIFAGTPIY